MYDCSTCTPAKKRLFGCGYDPSLRGQGQLREAKGIDAKGICPGWWRNSAIVDDVALMRDFRNNLGHPLNLPQRLVEALRYLENQEIISTNRKIAESLEKK